MSFTLNRGEICALVGQNGSGKSTLVKILSGFHDADPGGRVSLDGESSSLNDRHGSGAVWRQKIRCIHQDLGLIESMGAIDNLALGGGFETGRFGRIRWRREERRARALFADFGLHFDLHAPVASLSGVERTMIAVARALRDFDDGDGFLILDEPTAALPAADVDRLFASVRRLAARGAGVLFVSHRMDEVLGLGDRVVVLREGRVVADQAAEGLDQGRVIELIIGRSLEELYPQDHPARGRLVLSASQLRGRYVDGVDLAVRAGEIVGVAGLNGSGREELAELLFGIGPPQNVTIEGDAVTLTRPRDAMRHGIGLVPADRMRQGVIANHSVRENVSLPSLGRFVRYGRIRRRAERREIEDWCRRVDLYPLAIERPVGQFSGGNRQKAVIAKWLRREPKVFVLDEPTQGVDVGAKAAIYSLIVDATARGTAVVVCSSDNEELAELAHRVLVLSGGRVAAELSGEQLTVERLTEMTLRSYRNGDDKSAKVESRA